MSKYGKSPHGNTGRVFYFFAAHLLRLLLFFPSKSRSWKWLSRFNFEGARIPKSAVHSPTAGVFHQFASLRHLRSTVYCNGKRVEEMRRRTRLQSTESFLFRPLIDEPPFPLRRWMPLSIAERTLLRISLGIKLIEIFRLLGRSSTTSTSQINLSLQFLRHFEGRVSDEGKY